MSVLEDILFRWRGCLYSFRPSGQHMPLHTELSFSTELTSRVPVGVYREYIQRVSPLWKEKKSMLGLILSSSPYLRSAKGHFPSENLRIEVVERTEMLKKLFFLQLDCLTARGLLCLDQGMKIVLSDCQFTVVSYNQTVQHLYHPAWWQVWAQDGQGEQQGFHPFWLSSVHCLIY